MKKLSLCLLVFVSLFYSCQNDEVEYEKGTPALKMEFTYDGVLYSSAYHYSSDSIVILDDKKVSEVYNKLMENEQLATVVGEDGEIVYYDNYESVEDALPKVLDTNNTKSLSTNMSLYLYEHIGYAGWTLSYIMPLGMDVPSLDRLNDQVTSIIANFSYARTSYWDPFIGSGASLTIFEHINYGGKSLTFKSEFTSKSEMGGSGQIKINDLTPYVLKSGGLFSHSVRWNDQMSSAKLTFYK